MLAFGRNVPGWASVMSSGLLQRLRELSHGYRADLLMHSKPSTSEFVRNLPRWWVRPHQLTRSIKAYAGKDSHFS